MQVKGGTGKAVFE